MPNPIIQNYLNDEGIDRAKRIGVIEAMKAGQSDGELSSIITKKYGDKYGPAANNDAALAGGLPSFLSPKAPTPDMKPVSTNTGEQINQENKPAINKAVDAFTAPIRAIPEAGKEIIGGVGDVAGGLKDVVEGNVKAVGGLTGLYQPTEEDSMQAIKGVSKAVLGAGRVVASPVTGYIEAASPEVKEVIKPVMEAPNTALSAIFKTLRPDLSDQDIQENIVNPLWAALTVSGAKKATLKSKTNAPVITTGAKTAGISDTIASKVSGLDTNTIQTIKEAPTQFKKALKAGDSGVAKEAVFQGLKQKIDDLSSAYKSSGKAYSQFRESSQPIKVGNFMEEKITNAGLSIDKKGRVSSTSNSLVRSPADINKVQQLYDLYGKKPVLSSNEWLNLRSDLGDLGKYSSEHTSNLQTFAKGTRKDLNAKFRPQIPGMAEYDTMTSSLRKPIKDIKKVIYDKAGDERPDAISRVNNLLNEGKQGTLKTFEKIVPNFEEFKTNIRVAKALKDLENAKSNKVGTYTRSLVQGVGNVAGVERLFRGDFLGAAGGFAMNFITDPTIFSKVLAKYSELRGVPKAKLNKIPRNILSGKTLSSADLNHLSNLIEVSGNMLKTASAVTASQD